MAKYTISGTLSAITCPLISRHVREPVLVGKYDINYSKQIDSNEKQVDKETTLPVILYADNVLPTFYGYKSATFITLLERISADAEIQFAEAVTIADGTSYIYAYVIDAVTTANTGHWIAKVEDGILSWDKLASETFTGLPVITIATINGRVFINFAGVKTKELTAGTIADVTLTGLTAANILGIFASSGYLLTWTTSQVLWSALEDPTDFVPSDITGAGGASIQELRGRIIFCRGYANGFLVYSDLNAVYAQASADFRFPFIYKEMPGLAGISTIDSVSTGDPLTPYVFSGPGIFKITKTGAQPVLAEFNNLIAGHIIDVFNGSDFIEYQDAAIDAKLASIPGGIVIGSYGLSSSEEFSNFIYYAAELNRYSKLTFPHSFVVSFPYDTITTFSTIAQKQLDIYSTVGDDSYEEDSTSGPAAVRGNSLVALISKDGKITILIEQLNAPGTGTIIFGPYQMLRDASNTVTDIEFSSVIVEETDVSVLTSYTGAHIDLVTPLEGIQYGKKGIYPARVTGLSHAICITGSFDLSSMLLRLWPRGTRR